MKRWIAGSGGILLSLALLGSAAPASAADAGVRFDVEFRDVQGGKLEKARIWVAGRRIRIEQRSPGVKRPAHVLIYRGDRDTFLSLDARDQSYVAISRDMIAAFGVESRGARREVETRLQRLPDDQRRMLERLLGMRESDEPLVKATVRIVETGVSDRVGVFECRWRHILRNEEKIGEICLADWAAVGIGPKELEVFRQLANFQRELMGARDLTPFEIVPNQNLDLLVQFDGFPMHFRNLRTGKLSSEIRVEDAREASDLAGLFEPPASYHAKSVFSLFDQLTGGGETNAPAAAPAN